MLRQAPFGPEFLDFPFSSFPGTYLPTLLGEIRLSELISVLTDGKISSSSLRPAQHPPREITFDHAKESGKMIRLYTNISGIPGIPELKRAAPGTFWGGIPGISIFLILGELIFWKLGCARPCL